MAGCALFLAASSMAASNGNWNRPAATKEAPPAAAASQEAPPAAARQDAPQDLHILRRGEWGAKKPVLAMIPHKPRFITIHHSATAQKTHVSLKAKMRNLQAFSQRAARLASGKMKKAWADVPYHYYIDWKGDIAEGRDVRFAGDTNTAYDPRGHILIVLEGNFEKTSPGEQQIRSLERLAAFLAARWKIAPARIRTHRDYARTACPGRNLYKRMGDIRQATARAMQSGAGRPAE